jgi:MerR family transcriptional regulator/heat shock protein HspR
MSTRRPTSRRRAASLLPLPLTGEVAGLEERPPARGRTLQPQGHGPALAGVYVISVASRLLEMHPQTLRKYERMGFINPARTGGMLRLYSEHDIIRLRTIKYLVEIRGMNLAGVEVALRLANRLFGLRQLLEELLAADAEVKGRIAEELEGMMRLLHSPPSRDQEA